MKKISLTYSILICLIISTSVQGQSKKKQIELLNGKLDSLTAVNTELQKEFDEVSKNNTDLRSVITTLEDEIQRITLVQDSLVKFFSGQDSLVRFYEDSKILEGFIITPNSVGPYVIGNSFPEVDGIKSIRKQETRREERGRQYEVAYYDVFLKEEKLMKVYLNSFSEIESISTQSLKLQTSNGIRVGSTIEDFVKAFYNSLELSEVENHRQYTYGDVKFDLNNFNSLVTSKTKYSQKRVENLSGYYHDRFYIKLLSIEDVKLGSNEIIVTTKVLYSLYETGSFYNIEQLTLKDNRGLLKLYRWLDVDLYKMDLLGYEGTEDFTEENFYNWLGSLNKP